MDLVRDILDMAVVDRNGREMGRADGILIEVRGDKPPLVRAIEIGPAVLASRLHPALGRIAATLEEVLGVGEGRPVRIPMSQIDHVRTRIVFDGTTGGTGIDNVEHVVRRFLRRLAWR
jgi:sporulation protein YlmC with PRC-barrel domain